MRQNLDSGTFHRRDRCNQALFGRNGDETALEVGMVAVAGRKSSGAARRSARRDGDLCE